MIVFAGVSSYIGNIRARQDQGGAALSHITDLSSVHPSAIGNPAFTAGPQAMHTDPGEIIGMFCIETAAEGGESRVASSTTIYNELATHRPDLINTLAQPWVFDGYVSWSIAVVMISPYSGNISTDSVVIRNSLNAPFFLSLQTTK